MADVTFARGEYTNELPVWRLVADVCDGERSVKAGAEKYLPEPNPKDESTDNQDRFKQYIARAVFYNATGRTLQGLIGAVYRRAAEEDIPAVLEYVKEDIDGVGVSVYQQSQRVLSDVLKRGRSALLVDYPNVEKPTSKAAQDAGLVRASVVVLNADQIINWRTEKIGGTYRLSLVVIKESIEEITSDGFGSAWVDQYRVLLLQDGRYTVQIWQKPSSDWVMTEAYQPTDGAGKYWDEIPFTFVGSVNNDSEIDPSPLYDLAVLNVAHYRNSADYEDSAFIVGQAQPWLSGLNEEWRDHLEASGLYIGSRNPILLPEGGSFGIAQAQPNTIVKEAMDQKERQMVALGARLVEKGQAVKTATEAQSDSEAEHSVLSLVTSNVSSAYTKALGWMALFMASNDDVLFKLNQEFTELQLNAQMLTALVGAWQSGKLPSSDLWGQLRKFGVIDPEKDDEAIKEELQTEGAGLGLDDGNA